MFDMKAYSLAANRRDVMSSRAATVDGIIAYTYSLA